MRLLTLVRHAKSSWDDPDLADFERPLNERGRRDAPRMASHLRLAVGVPDRIVSSPALRAITTARSIAGVLGIDDSGFLIHPRIYEASLDTLLAIIRNLDDRDRHVMLFGHNPGLSELAHHLCKCPFDTLPTCAAAHFELQIKHWGDAGERCAELLHYGFPRQLRPADE